MHNLLNLLRYFYIILISFILVPNIDMEIALGS
jgi:hypothetical protein